MCSGSKCNFFSYVFPDASFVRFPLFSIRGTFVHCKYWSLWVRFQGMKLFISEISAAYIHYQLAQYKYLPQHRVLIHPLDRPSFTCKKKKKKKKSCILSTSLLLFRITEEKTESRHIFKRFIYIFVSEFRSAFWLRCPNSLQLKFFNLFFTL